MKLSQFEEKMAQDGWVVFERVLELSFIDRMRTDLEKAYEVCRAIQVRNGVAADTQGTVHHLIGIGESFLEYLDLLIPLMPYMESYFRGRFILNSFGGNILLSGVSYASRVHRDIRTHSGNLPLLLNTLVMLDDFTATNGATYLMTGSHRDFPEKPTDDAFYARAEQALAPAGSILMFNSNLWHAAGSNTSGKPRRSVTPMFCKPFMKQQCDYPRVLGYEKEHTLSEHRKQVLGYNARVPANLDEWYQPPERRMYRADQG